ncbi:MAG: phosphoadenylyl-sulfate reductase [Methylococcaceae bacterium]|nr:MAG: phosphoadenylyl-sulfate reductase [Methylococcaceae bacterium]
MNATDLASLQQQLAGANPRTILKAALSAFDKIAISFSGAEDVVLIDMACRIRENIEVFTLDTGRLHPETYRLLEDVRKRYPIRLRVMFPDPAGIEAMVQAKGLFSFYEEGHQECCRLRKVDPLKRALLGLDAWITGQRRDQSADTRQDLPEVQLDPAFATPQRPLIKFNPLAGWDSRKVWDHIEAYDVPYNELHRRGYPSIGCEPCTRSVLPNQHAREGRWWWEAGQKKECGLHVTHSKT